ncbi:hypothetical protein F2P79_015136 [Pimephales promelas]|nr:hypothetical protein F2P79_015136 [Pimephales promelas]
MLKIIVPPDSSGSSVPQIAGYNLEQSHSLTNRNMAFSSLFSIEQNRGFPQTQRRHKPRCALLGLDRPVVELKDVGGREVSVDIFRCGRDAFLALSHSLREKLSLLLVVSAAWLPKGGKKLFVLLGSKKCGHWPLQQLCQDLTPYWALILDLDRTSGRAGKGP